MVRSRRALSPRKLTVRPWKASDFPDLQTVTNVTETTYLETESSVKGGFNGISTQKFNGVIKKHEPVSEARVFGD